MQKFRVHSALMMMLWSNTISNNLLHLVSTVRVLRPYLINPFISFLFGMCLAWRCRKISLAEFLFWKSDLYLLPYSYIVLQCHTRPHPPLLHYVSPSLVPPPPQPPWAPKGVTYRAFVAGCYKWKFSQSSMSFVNTDMMMCVPHSVLHRCSAYWFIQHHCWAPLSN